MNEERFDRIDDWQRKADERFARVDERFDPTKREMDQGFADLRELIERRLDRLEAVVRHHTVEIEGLKKRSG